MTVKLPPAVAGFFLAHNTGQTEDLTSLFTDDAVVYDENREHRRTAIRHWIDDAVAQYKPQAEVIDVATSGDNLIVSAQISGTFPSSPVRLRYQFKFNNNKIAALTIGS